MTTTTAYREIPFGHGLCGTCDQVVPLSPGKAWGRVQYPAVMYVHGPRSARCAGSRQPPVPWVQATGLPGWDAMSDLDRGAALMFAWKVQREGYVYARENYPARYHDHTDLVALSAEDPASACRHARAVCGSWADVNDRLGVSEVARLYDVALAADRALAGAGCRS
jgi:hypothetical protein